MEARLQLRWVSDQTLIKCCALLGAEAHLGEFVSGSKHTPYLWLSSMWHLALHSKPRYAWGSTLQAVPGLQSRRSALQPGDQPPEIYVRLCSSQRPGRARDGDQVVASSESVPTRPPSVLL